MSESSEHSRDSRVGGSQGGSPNVVPPAKYVVFPANQVRHAMGSPLTQVTTGSGVMQYQHLQPQVQYLSRGIAHPNQPRRILKPKPTHLTPGPIMNNVHMQHMHPSGQIVYSSYASNSRQNLHQEAIYVHAKSTQHTAPKVQQIKEPTHPTMLPKNQGYSGYQGSSYYPQQGYIYGPSSNFVQVQGAKYFPMQQVGNGAYTFVPTSLMSTVPGAGTNLQHSEVSKEVEKITEIEQNIQNEDEKRKPFLSNEPQYNSRNSSHSNSVGIPDYEDSPKPLNEDNNVDFIEKNVLESHCPPPPISFASCSKLESPYSSSASKLEISENFDEKNFGTSSEYPKQDAVYLVADPDLDNAGHETDLTKRMVPKSEEMNSLMVSEEVMLEEMTSEEITSAIAEEVVAMNNHDDVTPGAETDDNLTQESNKGYIDIGSQEFSSNSSRELELKSHDLNKTSSSFTNATTSTDISQPLKYESPSKACVKSAAKELEMMAHAYNSSTEKGHGELQDNVHSDSHPAAYSAEYSGNGALQASAGGSPSHLSTTNPSSKPETSGHPSYTLVHQPQLKKYGMVYDIAPQEILNQEKGEKNPEKEDKNPTKTPEKVKRPMNAFMIWAQKRRPLLTYGYPGAPGSFISRKLGEIWNELTDEERKPFFEQADKLREEHFANYPDWSFKPMPKKKLSVNLARNNTPSSIGDGNKSPQVVTITSMPSNSKTTTESLCSDASISPPVTVSDASSLNAAGDIRVNKIPGMTEPCVTKKSKATVPADVPRHYAIIQSVAPKAAPTVCVPKYAFPSSYQVRQPEATPIKENVRHSSPTLKLITPSNITSSVLNHPAISAATSIEEPGSEIGSSVMNIEHNQEMKYARSSVVLGPNGHFITKPGHMPYRSPEEQPIMLNPIYAPRMTNRKASQSKSAGHLLRKIAPAPPAMKSKSEGSMQFMKTHGSHGPPTQYIVRSSSSTPIKPIMATKFLCQDSVARAPRPSFRPQTRPSSSYGRGAPSRHFIKQEPSDYPHPVYGAHMPGPHAMPPGPRVMPPVPRAMPPYPYPPPWFYPRHPYFMGPMAASMMRKRRHPDYEEEVNESGDAEESVEDEDSIQTEPAEDPGEDPAEDPAEDPSIKANETVVVNKDIDNETPEKEIPVDIPKLDNESKDKIKDEVNDTSESEGCKIKETPETPSTKPVAVEPLKENSALNVQNNKIKKISNPKKPSVNQPKVRDNIKRKRPNCDMGSGPKKGAQTGKGHKRRRMCHFGFPAGPGEMTMWPMPFSPYPMEGYYKQEYENAEENQEPYQWPGGDGSSDEQSDSSMDEEKAADYFDPYNPFYGGEYGGGFNGWWPPPNPGFNYGPPLNMKKWVKYMNSQAAGDGADNTVFNAFQSPPENSNSSNSHCKTKRGKTAPPSAPTKSVAKKGGKAAAKKTTTGKPKAAAKKKAATKPSGGKGGKPRAAVLQMQLSASGHEDSDRAASPMSNDNLPLKKRLRV